MLMKRSLSELTSQIRRKASIDMQSNNSAISHSAGSDTCENPEIEIQYPELPLDLGDEWLGETGSSQNQANEHFRNNLI